MLGEANESLENLAEGRRLHIPAAGQGWGVSWSTSKRLRFVETLELPHSCLCPNKQHLQTDQLVTTRSSFQPTEVVRSVLCPSPARLGVAPLIRWGSDMCQASTLIQRIDVLTVVVGISQWIRVNVDILLRTRYVRSMVQCRL